MSQAARNVRERESEAQGSRPSNGYYLVGIIFFLMVAGTIAWGGWMALDWMKDSSKLPLSKLVLTGERHYTTNDDVRKAILSLGTPKTFITQDVNAIQEKIKQLPWIQHVTVRKQWPDELKIHLVEYVPYARWNDTQLLDAEGQEFSLPMERIANRKYPILHGPKSKGKDVLREYHTMADFLEKHQIKLKAVSMTARNSWQLILDNNIRLELGTKDKTQRMKRFVELYSRLRENTEKRVDYIDLRYENGAAVGWTPLLTDKPVQ
ncbi:cell division protein FtsQ [Xenorhabdus vietnamensis]|uniref:Cell division protein FtsQ n=1 Tax=Xenorhabdus vietnamensis TaxID=351656 RepID=A0A1Y2SFI9_9GAMM|nr:cell division protein FtsQ [Xenorhabdus vietnamensis]OTA17116.1 cell division protein FtsQ [Xenorhabdus vietnamensis]